MFVNTIKVNHGRLQTDTSRTRYEKLQCFFFFKESHGKSTLKVELCVQQKRPFSFGSFSKEKEEE